MILDKVEGREDDIFILKSTSGEEIKIFPDFLRRAFMFSSGEILEYNIIQKTFTEIDISFIPGDYGNYDVIKEKIKENLYELFSNYNIELENIKLAFSDYEKKNRLAKKRDIKREF